MKDFMSWAPWALGGLIALSVIASIWNASGSVERARIEEGRMIELTERRQALEQAARADSIALVDEWDDHIRIADSLQTIRERSEAAILHAVMRADSAARDATDLREKVAGAASDSATVVAVVDSLNEAHAREVSALRSQIGELQTQVASITYERDSLEHILAASDSARASQSRRIAAIERERESLRSQTEEWKDAATTSKWERAGQAAAIAGAVILGSKLGG